MTQKATLRATSETFNEGIVAEFYEKGRTRLYCPVPSQLEKYQGQLPVE